jgi:hypothetical protein
MFGSHIDSVPGGGNYDGDVGVIGALEVVEALKAQGRTTRHALEVVVFADEEGGTVGSKAMAGADLRSELELMSHSGRVTRDGIAFIGGDPGRIVTARRRPGEIAAYVELHIEQGARLADAGIEIGVVEGIVGIGWWEVTVQGEEPPAPRRWASARTRWPVPANWCWHRRGNRSTATQVATVGRNSGTGRQRYRAGSARVSNPVYRSPRPGAGCPGGRPM